MESRQQMYQPLISSRDIELQPASQFQQPINPQQSPSNTIACGGCRSLLRYPNNILCVQCPNCQTMTAIKPVGRITCASCNSVLVFPAEANKVRCPCGNISNLGSFPTTNTRSRYSNPPGVNY